MNTEIPTFKTVEAAYVWLDDTIDDPCIDNYRFAFKDDAAAMARYEDRKSEGCCGFADRDVIVDGREALVGCNYGH